MGGGGLTEPHGHFACNRKSFSGYKVHLLSTIIYGNKVFRKTVLKWCLFIMFRNTNYTTGA